jgi:hypothetical protein
MMPLGLEVYYRVHQKDGGTFVGASRAWDVERFQKALAESYMKAKDGPHIVEFITKEEYNKERKRS